LASLWITGDDIQITTASSVLGVSVFNSPSNSSRVENVLLIIAFEPSRVGLHGKIDIGTF